MSHKAAVESRARRQARAAKQTQSQHRRHSRMVWAAAGLVLTAVVAAMMLTSRPSSSDTVQDAPGFTLTDTTGASHTLAQHRGQNVLIYFSEGAGCQSCLVQIGEIEKKASDFAAQNITVLPVVMNTKEQITHDMAINGVTTPFLLDDGTVSNQYGTLGKGMHAGLPGHSFVLIDAEGKQRWYGEYPSMWLSPADLLDQVRSHLSS